MLLSMGNKASAVAEAVDAVLKAIDKDADNWKEHLSSFNEAVPLWLEVSLRRMEACNAEMGGGCPATIWGRVARHANCCPGRRRAAWKIVFWIQAFHEHEQKILGGC